jgi:hypothetical protein
MRPNNQRIQQSASDEVPLRTKLNSPEGVSANGRQGRLCRDPFSLLTG